MFYLTRKWKDQNVNKVCASEITIQEFFEKCNPQITAEDRQELFYHYFHDYFHDHMYRIDPEWLAKQWDRSDFDDRAEAFYDSIYDAITTDTESWRNKGRDIMAALMSNNATELLIALCGWGAESLAKRVLLMRGIAQYSEEEVEGKIMVQWDDGNRYSTACLINAENHQVFDFNHDIFIREDNSDAHIAKVFVRVDPLKTGNEFDLLCISKEERDRANDDEVFWYDPDEEAEE